MLTYAWHRLAALRTSYGNAGVQWAEVCCGAAQRGDAEQMDLLIEPCRSRQAHAAMLALPVAARLDGVAQRVEAGSRRFRRVA
jgi:hypothetical protein